MPVSTIDHINLRASRELLDELRDFYTDVVGLTEGHRPPFSEFGYWLYAGERAVVHLSLAAADEERAADAASTIAHVAFACSGRTRFERRLADCGVQYKVAVVPGTGVTQLFCADPAGNVIELSFATDES